MTAPLIHRRDARAPATLALALGTLGLAVALWGLFQAAWWIALPIGLIALPALYEAWQGRIAALALDDRRLTWHSGARRGDIALARIRQARFRTTFDMSQRLTLELDDGQRARIPPECLPPGRTLEQAFQDRTIPTKRTILFD